MNSNDLDMMVPLGEMNTFKERYSGFKGADMLALLGVSKQTYDFLVMNQLLVSDLEIYWDRVIENERGRLTIYNTRVDDGMIKLS